MSTWNPMYNRPTATDIYTVKSADTGQEHHLKYSVATFKWTDPESGIEYKPINRDQWKPKLNVRPT